MKSTIVIFLIALCFNAYTQPTISLTFDDGITQDYGEYAFKDWNQMILDALKEHNLQAMFFVMAHNKLDEKGKYLMKSWDDENHLIANHTYTHPNFDTDEMGAAQFEKELLETDEVIKAYKNYTKFFRFPYLAEGTTREKTDSLHAILKKYGYGRGHVTIDAWDWFVDVKLSKRLKKDPKADIEAYKRFYLQNTIERAKINEKLSYELTGRHVKHVLLLHHNLTSALFLNDMIKLFKAEGWNVISAEEAYKDPIFEGMPYNPDGSLIRSMAIDSINNGGKLRHFIPEMRSEEERMKKLGL